MRQNALHDSGVLDVRHESQPTATLRTRGYVDPEAAPSTAPSAGPDVAHVKLPDAKVVSQFD